MTHWKSLQDRDFMYAFDLAGKDVTLTIDRVVGGQLVGTGGKKSKKPLCHFKEGREPKPLALNATNCKTIAAMYGNDVENWSGKRITIYPTKTQMGGEEVDCIRVRPKKPAAARSAGNEPREPEPPQSPPLDDAGDPNEPPPGVGVQ
jgi:hypothetical protein